MSDAPRILVCEDERHLLDDICAELNEAGYLTIPAVDGQEALARMQDLRPDLILCDIAMPRLDGRGLLSQLRETRRDLDDVPFLFLTAFGDRSDVIDGKLRGADDYIVKPVDYEVLLATIAAQLRQVRRVNSARDEAERLNRTRKALSEAESGAWQALDRLAQGIVLLDRQAQVLHANAAATAFCQEGSGLRLCSHLHAEVDPPHLRQTLQAALARNPSQAPVAPVPLERPDRAQGPILLLSSLGRQVGSDAPALMVLIVDPGRRVAPEPALLREALRLTPTEARIASLLAGGLRSDAIAETLGISPATVASHLKSIFAKTETHRQTDLVALLLSLSAIPSPK
ncbi:regulatory protein, luxR family [Pseudooceanicola antarcticus]|uniref:Regulatory protein, luxR family n=1 Tax=Pseudooceanicola antarcticus TaxID=1247613 RepID=A0A285JFI7_9RHOB|nr:response regulator [Pseudooceanicola antarcticus]PJE30987.1 two-component system response regulator [Pseudooceanicola antarcticus]SNY59060.1 regulatory protein, luxR family [Pseudooceanicola antarcticus]